MRRWLWLVLGVVVAGTLGACGFVLLRPRIGTATRAEIEAALPASLKVIDAPDPAAEARYARLLALAKRMAPAKKPSLNVAAGDRELQELERLLLEGPLRVPAKGLEGPYGDFSTLKDAAKAIGLATTAARKRGDRAACGRWAALGVRYGSALRDSGGVVIDALVHVAASAIALRSAYVAEIEGGLDRAGEERLLALLSPEDGRAPAMAAALRRDFRLYLLPILIDPKANLKELAMYGGGYEPDDPDPKPDLVGTLDPVATARLTGAIYDAAISDLGRPYPKALRAQIAIAEAAAEGLPNPAGAPSPGDGTGGAWAKLKYRIAMNAGRNTLGRQVAASSMVTSYGEAAVREAANVNLLRAVLLLRMGRPAKVADPFGSGNLHIDPRRKVVWSVGTNGKDDGGSIGRGGEHGARDLGYPYGDRSYHPAAPLPFSGGAPPGMPTAARD